jgi:hypothetical protein
MDLNKVIALCLIMAVLNKCSGSSLPLMVAQEKPAQFYTERSEVFEMTESEAQDEEFIAEDKLSLEATPENIFTTTEQVSGEQTDITSGSIEYHESTEREAQDELTVEDTTSNDLEATTFIEHTTTEETSDLTTFYIDDDSATTSETVESSDESTFVLTTVGEPREHFTETTSRAPIDDEDEDEIHSGQFSGDSKQ